MGFWSSEEESSPYRRGLITGTVLGAGTLLLGFILLRRKRHSKHRRQGHGPRESEAKSGPRHRHEEGDDTDRARRGDQSHKKS